MYVFARITTCMAHYEFLEILKQQRELYVKAIVSQEMSEQDKLHLHCLIDVASDSTPKNIYQNFRNFIKRVFPETNGQKDYAITRMNMGTEQHVAAYTVKEGQFSSYGFTTEFIKNAIKLSYKKKKATDFKDAKQRLENRFILDEIHEREFIAQYYDLLFEYRMKNTYQQIYSYIEWCIRLKYPDRRERFVRQLYDDLDMRGLI